MIPHQALSQSVLMNVLLQPLCLFPRFSRESEMGKWELLSNPAAINHPGIYSGPYEWHNIIIKVLFCQKWNRFRNNLIAIDFLTFNFQLFLMNSHKHDFTHLILYSFLQKWNPLSMRNYIFHFYFPLLSHFIICISHTRGSDRIMCSGTLKVSLLVICIHLLDMK